MKRFLFYFIVVNTLVPCAIFYVVYHLPEWNYFMYAESKFLQSFWNGSLLIWIRFFTGPTNLIAFIIYCLIKDTVGAEQKLYNKKVLIVFVVLGFLFYFWQIGLLIRYFSSL